LETIFYTPYQEMISIIICSTQPSIPEKMRKNIEEKIGVPFEIIGIDNSNNTYSIFSAYNEGIERSSYELVCFIHEDILFHTTDWGLRLQSHLKDPKTGIVGVCGCTTLSKIPGPWSLYNPYKYILQSSPAQRKPELQKSGFVEQNERKEVLAIDGVFMCARKELFEKICFDSKNFSGYHSYDIDICLQAFLAGYKNYAVNDILIEHFSRGHHSRSWIENSMKLTDKWGSQLPISLNQASMKQLTEMEYQYMTVNFAKYMIRAGFTNKECTQVVGKYLQHHEKSKKRLFLRKIAWKIVWMRILKKPFSLLYSPKR
jgi:hypothetical protein